MSLARSLFTCPRRRSAYSDPKSTGFLPKQSDSLDVMIWQLVLATRKLVPAQVIDEAACRSSAMTGRMVLTLVASIKDRNKASCKPKNNSRSLLLGRIAD